MFVPAVDSFDQLYIGMRLPGIVDNITAFGAFVNLGIHENGLLHISKISHRRINSVSDVLHIGQIVDVEVIDVDSSRMGFPFDAKPRHLTSTESSFCLSRYMD